MLCISHTSPDSDWVASSGRAAYRVRLGHASHPQVQRVNHNVLENDRLFGRIYPEIPLRLVIGVAPATIAPVARSAADRTTKSPLGE